MIAGGQIDFMHAILRRTLLMKKLIGIFAFLTLSAAPVMAQGYARFDFSAGGDMRLFQQAENPRITTIGMPGWYASGDYNFHKFRNHFAVEIQASGNYRDQGDFGKTSVYTALMGPKIYPFGHHKLTPYGHVLFGGGYYRNEIPAQSGFDAAVQSSSTKAWQGGVGLDMNIKKHWGVRLLELDYTQTRFFGYKITENNYQANIGIVYRFGSR